MIELTVRMGEFVPPGGIFAAVHQDAGQPVAAAELAAYTALEAAADPARRAGLTARREELSLQLASDGTAQQALRPDPMGLG